MAEENHLHRRNQSTPLSIPLQDLSRPPEDDQGYYTSSPHRRTLSNRGRDLFARSSSRTQSGRYRVLRGDAIESSDNPAAGEARPSIRRLNSDSSVEDGREEPESPFLEDPSQFQAAMGFSGLSFQGETSRAHLTASSLPDHSGGLNNLVGHNNSDMSLEEVSLTGVGSREDSSYTESERAPLTDARHVQQVAGRITPSTPSGQRHDRLSPSGVHFSPPSRTARLGDDLGAAETGNRGRSNSISRTLAPSSPSSPLNRASTIVRKMSQRVVNLSNEPEVVDQEIRRRHSKRRQEDHKPMKASETSHDGAVSPVEKGPTPGILAVEPRSTDWVRYANPLRGKSLGVFPPDSKLRTMLCNFLTQPLIEPLILVLIVIQTILLAVDAAPNWYDEQGPTTGSWNSSWIDWCLLALFIIYTVEIAIRIIVSGFVVNPVEYSTINRQVGFREAVVTKANNLFALHRETSAKRTHASPEPPQRSIFRTFTSNPGYAGFASDGRHDQRVRLAHRAFLRHSFNRLDFLAVASYWINFALLVSGYKTQQHVHAFGMLSSLRILRLLSFTNGTSVILRSMKKAAPLLLNVSFLIGFFWLLFAIIGVQAFKSSLRRNCVWVDPDITNPQQNYTTNHYGDLQFCGGSIDDGGARHAWTYSDGTSSGNIKGYLCPPNSWCVSADNPYNGTVSFDNIFQSLEQVFIITTSNTYTDIMYYLTDSDYLIVALYFAFGIVFLTFWLMNLLIAVITSSFQVIREESHTSAFGTDESKEAGHSEESQPARLSTLKRFYNKSYWFWIVVITYGLLCQCLRSAAMSSWREHFVDNSETTVTFILLVEILLRFASDWRKFIKSRQNLFDLFLAVVTTVIQIPPIHRSGRPYAWMTIFQIIRIYRVVLAIPWTRELILLVLGKVSGLANLILFVFLLTFLGAIFASQLFRGELPQEDENGDPIRVTFFTIWNCFLGMYQVLSSENWTELLYNITSYDKQYNTSWIGAVFFILWFILGFFIVLNMFIAVIQENFDVTEDEKRLQQVKAFLQQKELGGSSHGTLSLSSMFKLRTITGRRQDPLDYGPAMMEMLLKDAVVKDFLDENFEPVEVTGEANGKTQTNGSRPISMSASPAALGSIWAKIKTMIWGREPNPFYSSYKFSRAYEELDPRAMAKEVVSAAERRKRAQRDYLKRHPKYNVSLFIFSPEGNPIRRLCQKMVGPGRGRERIQGAAPSPVVWYAFSALLYAAIVAMVLLACVTTPLYQKNYWRDHDYSVKNWFVFTDLAFAVIFTVEAFIRVVADGLFITPHAYFRSSWGIIDGIVLITLWINCISSLYNEGAVSRAVGAFKALRALRLLNVSDSARDTFHSVIVRGGWKVVSAAFVSLSLLIPFAIYGLNLFNGQMDACNDSDPQIFYLTDCVNEYLSSPSNWDVLAPRQASNPWYDFDNFGNSLFILFQIVSQEGWVDVMWSAQSITGFHTQPAPFASQGNAVFFVIFNLLGAVFVLTLFVSVFMRNYTEQTGVAYLTTDQRSWLELRKLLRQISPSKRPKAAEQGQTWTQWCYRRASRKTGQWQRFVTWVMVFHLVLLCVEFYPEPLWWQYTRDAVFTGLVLFYIGNIVIRIVGLTWTRFRRSSWDVYSLLSVGGSFVTMVMHLSNYQQRVYAQINKIFLVSIVLLLIPRNNQLDQLFKTAAASLTAIGNLLATWFVLFLVYAIAFTQTFGLTRFGDNEDGNINFRNVPKALILLFRMSTGEGWDELMEDFASIEPPFCNTSRNFLDNDCGSPNWARALFISWNILSMYIFVNMFVSLIYESFSYVYQRSSGLSVISRKEIRRFKQAWAEHDPDGSGYISKESFPRFLGELSGVFEMRIYPDEFTVGSLKESSKATTQASSLPIEDPRYDGASNDIDIEKLNARLVHMPLEEVRARRTRLNVFYEEVMVSADPDRGIGFTSLLMVLAHYKVINDNKSLRLEEFLRRRARLQRVEEAVRRAIVIGFFDTLFWSRRFKQHMAKKRSAKMTEIPQLQVPEIFVEDEALSSSGTDSPNPFAESPRDPARPRLALHIPEGNDAQSSSTDVGRSSTDGLGGDSAPAYGLRNRADSIQKTPVTSASPLGRALEQERQHRHSRSISSTTVGRDSADSSSVPSAPPLRIQPSRRERRHRVSTDEVAGEGTDQNRLHSRDASGATAQRGHHGRDSSLQVDGDLQMPSGEGIEGLGISTRSGGANRSRGESNVSARDVLQVLDNSAWGESIRRSFTVGGGGGSSSGNRRSGRVSARLSGVPALPTLLDGPPGDQRDGSYERDRASGDNRRSRTLHGLSPSHSRNPSASRPTPHWGIHGSRRRRSPGAARRSGHMRLGSDDIWALDGDEGRNGRDGGASGHGQ